MYTQLYLCGATQGDHLGPSLFGRNMNDNLTTSDFYILRSMLTLPQQLTLPNNHIISIIN